MRVVLVTGSADEYCVSTESTGFETQLSTLIAEVGYGNIIDIKFSSTCCEPGDLEHHALVLIRD